MSRPTPPTTLPPSQPHLGHRRQLHAGRCRAHGDPELLTIKALKAIQAATRAAGG